MKQRALASSILVGLCATFCIPAVNAQDAGDTPAPDQARKDDAQTFETVMVTGSLIPRAQIETASPVITITAEQLQREGFKNVYDALRSLPVSTGQVQDNQSTNSFTPGATTVSLLGLDPSFTLVLMNGRPLADYPFLYNSNSNFTDLNTIPTFLVDHHRHSAGQPVRHLRVGGHRRCHQRRAQAETRWRRHRLSRRRL
jgi:outer membrane receptor for ferrienterochelin and colicin